MAQSISQRDAAVVRPVVFRQYLEECLEEFLSLLKLVDLPLFILGRNSRCISLEEVPQRIFSRKDVLLGRTVALILQLSGAKVRLGQLSWTQNVEVREIVSLIPYEKRFLCIV